MRQTLGQLASSVDAVVEDLHNPKAYGLDVVLIREKVPDPIDYSPDLSVRLGPFFYRLSVCCPSVSRTT
ncbi:hypothetical protein MDUV_11330 [Mycolicibacterium duvalii]|uniref:Uncharacterized protein n=1 Tax=Mycolicibacterium duvalii TaxID=39688 RepID=A0A7I7JWV3_9MYCO|nr:hypothetical protein MDUV_11330 [Mycolicibacterium duvalii]